MAELKVKIHIPDGYRFVEFMTEEKDITVVFEPKEQPRSTPRRPIGFAAYPSEDKTKDDG